MMIKTILKNSSSNGAVVFIRLGIAFVMSPIIVRALGNHDYGIWEIVFSVVGYMGLLDLGIKPALVHYVAKYNALKDKEKLNKLYSSSLFFAMIGGGVASLFLVCWAFMRPDLLASQGSDSTRYFFFLLIIGIQVLVSFPGYVPTCFHHGFQRYHLQNQIDIVLTLITSSILFVLLQRGHGLLTLALFTAIGVFLRVLIHLFLLSIPKYGSFKFSKGNVSLTTIKELLTFGFKNLVRSISTAIVGLTDSIVIGAFLGPAIVTFYAIPARLIQYTLGFIKSMTLPFMPFFSHMDAQKDTAQTEYLYTVVSKYTVGLVLPILGALSLLGIPFLRCWMGPEYAAKGRWVLYFLTGAWALNLLNPLSNDYLVGIGRHGVLAKIKFTVAIMNLVLSLIFVQYYGKEGVALGTLIPMIIFEPVILYYTCKCAGITMWYYVCHVLFPAVIPMTLFIVLLRTLSFNFRLRTYSSILGVGIFSVFVYSLLFFVISVGKEEKKFFLAKIKASFA